MLLVVADSLLSRLLSDVAGLCCLKGCEGTVFWRVELRFFCVNFLSVLCFLFGSWYFVFSLFWFACCV